MLLVLIRKMGALLRGDVTGLSPDQKPLLAGPLSAFDYKRAVGSELKLANGLVANSARLRRDVDGGGEHIAMQGENAAVRTVLTIDALSKLRIPIADDADHPISSKHNGSKGLRSIQ